MLFALEDDLEDYLLPSLLNVLLSLQLCEKVGLHRDLAHRFIDPISLTIYFDLANRFSLCKEASLLQKTETSLLLTVLH